MFDVFDKVVNTDTIENGAWLHYRDPGSDEPLYIGNDGRPTTIETDRPCRALVRSTMSNAFDGHLDSVQRASANRARQQRGKAGQDAMLAQLKLERPKSFAALAIAFENVSADAEGEIRPSKEELIKLATPRFRMWMVDQTLEFASDPVNYGGVVLKKPGEDEDDQGNALGGQDGAAG